jgi:protein-disulfide isomerase
MNDKKLNSVLKDLGYDLKEIEKRMKSETINDVLNKDIKLANNLELRGTPVFIIKDEIFFGYVGYEAMADALKD